MSFAHKVVLLVMQRQGCFVTEQKTEFFYTLLFCGKADFRSANLTSKVILYEIVRVASITKACELTE